MAETTTQFEQQNENLEQRAPQTALVKSETQVEGKKSEANLPAQSREPKRSRNLQKWLIRIAVLLVIGLGIGFFVWRRERPPVVTLTQPKLATITETVASSGRVGGVTETLVGAQATGIVQRLFVKQGDRVTAGQKLAVLKNDVAEAQISQVEQAVETAQAQLAQTSRGPLPSEVEAAREQAQQAQAQTVQQQAAIAQANQSVSQARAQLNQLKAERDLAANDLTRTRTLAENGLIAKAEYEKAQTNLRVAEERVSAQEQAIQLAQSNVRQAQASLNAAQANLRVRQAQQRTIESGARPEDVQVARQRLRESEQALRVARQQAANAVVVAPFDGLVTQINAEPGQTVGAQGVLQLVSSQTEIRLDVDESNLADLQVGQTAIISSSTFPGSSFEGRVTELGAAVNVARGTIQVKIAPINPPDWLQPGQTVNVNVVTARNVQRLLVPQTSLTRVGDRTVVFVVKDGVALEKPVLTRAPTDQGVPVLAGLSAEDRIITEVGQIKAGQAVRVKKGNG